MNSDSIGDRPGDLESRLAEALRENELLRSQLEIPTAPNSLDQEALESLADGFALFDTEGRLLLFNNRYRDEIFPELADIIQPGVSYQTLLRGFFERGLWTGTGQNLDEFMRSAEARHHELPSVIELELPDFRCIRQNKRRTPTGGVVAIYTDITDSKRREQALSESEERHRRLMETLPDAVIIHSDGKIAFVNPAAIDFFGARDHTQLVGRNSLELVHPDSRKIDTQRSLQVLTERRTLPPIEQKALQLDGSIIDVDTRSTFINWNGKPALLSVVRDLTERNRTQNFLRQSEERYRRLVELSPDSIHVECDDRIIFINSAGLALFGASTAEDIIGRSTLEFVHPDDHAMVRERQKIVLAGDSAPMVEQNRMRSDGSTYWAAVIGIPMSWQGKPAELVVTRDITHQKHAETGLKDAKEAAEFANRSKTEFLANMSHELRTPLNAVIGFSEIMKGEMFGPIGHENYLGYVNDIHESGSHLLKVINDLLDLSKVEAGKMEPRFELVDVSRVIAASLRIVDGRARECDISITTKIEQDLPKIDADERMLKQILMNLLSNAVKFTPEGGKIRLRARALGADQIELSVTDTGIGIARADIAAVMEPFGQVESILTRKFDGTGLGLPLTKSLVEMHGGVLVVNSKQGMGTKVTIKLPRNQ